MSFDMDGFDDVEDSLEELRERGAAIEDTDEIPNEELFSDRFMDAYTEFSSLSELREQSPWPREDEKDIETIPQDELDQYIDENTYFANYEAMKKKARNEWISEQLGL